IIGQLSYAAVSTLADFGQVFGYHWDNKENKLLEAPKPKELDVTEFTLNLTGVSLSLVGRESVTHVRMAEGAKVQ
ncbi:hypothetical protein SARC_16054, partial [Sphaeroforma arctica JP610]